MKNIFCFITMVLLASSLMAQSLSPEVTAISGEFFQGQNHSLSWTLGEIVTETIASSDHILTQGFQQDFPAPFAIEEQFSSEQVILAYPNPVKDFLTIASKKEMHDADIHVFDVHSTEIYHARMNGSKTLLNLSSLPAGMYFIRISDINYSKAFKIHKY